MYRNEAQPEAMSRPVWYCAKCGGTDIRHDAIVSYNPEARAGEPQYEILGVLDTCWCETCMEAASPGDDEGDPQFGVLGQENDAGMKRETPTTADIDPRVDRLARQMLEELAKVALERSVEQLIRDHLASEMRDLHGDPTAAVDGAMANLRDAILRNDGLTRKNTLAAFRAVENALAAPRRSRGEIRMSRHDEVENGVP